MFALQNQCDTLDAWVHAVNAFLVGKHTLRAVEMGTDETSSVLCGYSEITL